VTRYAYTLIFLCLAHSIVFCFDSKVYADESFRADSTAQIYIAKWRKNLDSLNLVRFSGSSDKCVPCPVDGEYF
jgi:hypothetical protein